MQRFVFEDAPVRGQLVRLDATWREVLARHTYPAWLRDTLGELMAAAALLAATLKFSGALVMQLQGRGPVKLLVAECSSELELRATAHCDEYAAPGGLRQMMGDGKFAITIDPRQAGRRSYQGIVALDGDSLSEVLEHYLHRSEQIDSRLWLAADGEQAAGMLLQRLPGEGGGDDTWERAQHLAATLSRAELLQLPAAEVIRRLFHEEDIRLFRAKPVRFACSCSEARAAAMLRMLGREEVDGIIAERGLVEVHCEFCNARYAFDPQQAASLFAPPAGAAGSTRH